MSKQVEEALQALGARLRGFRKDAGFTSGRAFARATSSRATIDIVMDPARTPATVTHITRPQLG